MDKVRKVSLSATVTLSAICTLALASPPAAEAKESKQTSATVAPELPNADKLIYGEVAYPDGESSESCSLDSKPSEAGAGEPEALAPDLPAVDRLLSDPDATIKQAKPGIAATAITVPNLPKPAPKAISSVAQMKLFYKQGKYKDCLNIIEKTAPTELTQYYAGLCYQGQGQLGRATSTFQWVASSARDPLIRYNAQMALQSVSSYARARTYAGQGNNFARASGGGGGTVIRRG